MPPTSKSAPRVSPATAVEPAKKRPPPTRPRGGPSKSQQMTQIQRENLDLLLAQNADREYLDVHVMPFLFVALQDLLERRPDRPLAYLAERLLRMEEGNDRPALPISWGPVMVNSEEPVSRAAVEPSAEETLQGGSDDTRL